jgi:urease accessory protein
MPDCIAATLLSGLLVVRYLGDSTEQAFEAFSGIWRRLRPAVLGRAGIEPRLWRT